MPVFGVSRQKEQALRKKMDALGVREEDLEERFIRSRGPGGQNVNKVSTCVHLRHLPTGFLVKAGRERSQALNRYLARRRLVEKIESEQLGRLSEEQQRREKIRRQKRKRSKRAKDKMLQAKKLQSEKKRLRAPPTADE